MKRSSRLRTEFAVFCLRLWVGLNFAFGHGLAKLQDPDSFLASELVAKFPSPDLMGWIAIIAEFAGGLLLTIGCFTRTAAGVLLATMLGAALIALQGAPWGERELSLTYAVGLLVLMLHGPGALSVDEMIEKARRRRSPW